MLTKEEVKQRAASSALPYIQPGMTIGIGTDSTVYWFIHELSRMVKNGFVCRCVPTSNATRLLATQLGIPLLELNAVEKIDVTIDGADETDGQLRLIKGGGGALLQEKMVAAASDKLVIIADSGKLVQQLGAFPLPVEVIPYGWKQVQRRIQNDYSVETSLRTKEGATLVTDHGHYILDCHFQEIAMPELLSVTLNTLPGVVENGLFIQMAAVAIIAYPDDHVETIHSPDTFL